MDGTKISKIQIAEAERLSKQIGVLLEKSMPKDWEPNKGTGAVPLGILINLRISIDHIPGMTYLSEAQNAFFPSREIFNAQWKDTVKPNLKEWAGKHAGTTEGYVTESIIVQIDGIQRGVDEFAKVLAK